MIAQGKRVSIPGQSKQKKKRKWEDESEESIDSDPTTPSPVSAVDQSIVDSVLLRLKQHQNAPDRLSSKRVKRPKSVSNDELEEDTNTKSEPIIPVEQQSSTNQTPNFYQMQHPVAINDYMTQSYSDYHQKYPIQYSPTQNWSNSQNYYYYQMNSYDHSSQQFHSNNASSQQYSSSTSSSSFSSSSSFNYSN
jgi:hypothetical protein